MITGGDEGADLKTTDYKLKMTNTDISGCVKTIYPRVSFDLINKGQYWIRYDFSPPIA